MGRPLSTAKSALDYPPLEAGTRGGIDQSRRGATRRRLAAGPIAALVLLLTTSQSPAADLAQLEQSALKAAASAVAPSVVQIQTVGGLDQVGDVEIGQGPTTGLIVAPDGYIVASAFGFAQEPTSIVATLPGGQQLPAELIGRDANRMLVLLKVDADQPLAVPEPAPLAEVRPGDWAVALGRTYGQQEVSVSVGIVSAINRMYGRALQTDANVSASNYGGPLVDVYGRVLGVLVPMAPQAGGSSEVNVTAGAEFYDSGIGFAVPLEDTLGVLDRWKADKDLKRGLLGISLKSGNPHSTPPVVTAVWPRSPAAAAGWQADDRIVAVNGEPLDTQTQLRFQVATRYAGDMLHVAIRRGKGDDAKEIETDITLADKLPSFRHAFLGILPSQTIERAAEEADQNANGDDPESTEAEDPNTEPADGAAEEEPPKEQESDEVASSSGVLVAAVWPGSPADKAGITAGDQITKLGDKRVSSVREAVTELNAKNSDDKLNVVVNRDGEELDFEVALADLPTDILAASDLPERDSGDSEDNGGEPTLEELKVPEMPQTARYYRPAESQRPRGLLIWLGGRGEDAAQAQAAAWREVCERDDFILLMPEPADAAGWSTDDLEYLARLLQTALARFDLDPQRIAVVGEGRGGQLAYALAFGGRRFVRGAVAIDSPLPRTLQVPENNPNERLAVLSIETQDAAMTLLIHKDLKRLAEAGYPVTTVERRSPSSDAGLLDSSSRAKIARWLAGLNRF